MGTSVGDSDEASLSIISVVYQNERFLERNVELTRSLNASFDGCWLVVDNGGDDSPVSIPEDGRVRLLPGVVRPQARDAGACTMPWLSRRLCKRLQADTSS